MVRCAQEPNDETEKARQELEQKTNLHQTEHNSRPSHRRTDIDAPNALQLERLFAESQLIAITTGLSSAGQNHQR